MISILIYLALGAAAMGLLFLTAEFYHHQRGHSTWSWVRWLYRATGAWRVRW